MRGLKLAIDSEGRNVVDVFRLLRGEAAARYDGESERVGIASSVSNPLKSKGFVAASRGLRSELCVEVYDGVLDKGALLALILILNQVCDGCQGRKGHLNFNSLTGNIFRFWL